MYNWRLSHVMRKPVLSDANNKGADQPAPPRSLISTFVVRCLDSIIPLVSISETSSLYLASMAVQVGLSFTWSETPKTGFLMTRLNSFLYIWILESGFRGCIMPAKKKVKVSWNVLENKPKNLLPLLNPHLPSGILHPYQMDKSISNFMGVWCTFYILILFLIEIPEDPDQTPRFAAFDLGLHYLPMSQKWDARLIWVNW